MKQQEKLNKEKENEYLRMFKEQEKKNKEQQKEQQKVIQTKTKKIIDNDTNSLYSETGHINLGLEKNLLLKKVKQYKSLFSNELKRFKIKPNATEQELKNYIDEMQIITELDSVDDFLTESILSSIKVIEGTTKNFKNYDISGLSDMLKENKQFNTLCKQLYIKYGCYNNISPEYQMLFLIATSTYIIRNKNIKKKELENFLNEEIKI